MKRIRKSLSIFLSFLMMISMTFGMSFSAYADTCEYVYDEKTHTVYINGTGEASDMDTAFGDEKYQEVVNGAQNVVVGEGVTKIGTALFMDFDITSVSLSSTVEEIGKDAFRNTVLNKINLKNVKTIGDYAFYNTYIRTADLSSVQTIGKYAFSKSNIEKLVANNCETIGDYAFASCLSLEYVETTAKTIGRFAFTKDAKIKTIKLSDVVSIEQSAFFCCEGIKSINLPKSLKTILNNAFYGCRALQSVKIEDGADVYIFEDAFASCENLTLMYIPASVTKFDDGCMLDSQGIKNVYIITPPGSCAEQYAKDYGLNYTNNTGSVTVTFDAGDGKCEIANATYTVGDSYGELPDCKSDNYVFKGWESESKREIDFDCLVYPADHILHAIYGGEVRTVTFDADGGRLTGESKFQVDYGEKIGEYGDFPSAKKVGYTFNGWFTESGEEVTVDTVYNFDGDITLTARYVPITYTITLYSVVGSRVWLDKSYSVKYDEEFILPNAADIAPDIAKDKRFLGWSTSKNEADIKYKDGQALKGLHDSQGANINIYALWLGYTEVTVGETKTVNISSIGADPASYYSGFCADEDNDYLIKVGTKGLTITLKDNDGKTIATSDNLKNGGYARITANLKKGNYRLNVRTQSIPCTFTITVVKTQSATAIFDPNGGTVSKTSMKVAAGDEFGIMPVPKKDGYRFTGWVDESSNAIRSKSIVPFGKDEIKLTATWTPITYTFTFYDTSGSKITTQTFTYDVAQNLMSAEELGVKSSKHDSIFVGWSTAINSTTVAYTDCQSIYKQFSTSNSVALYPVYVKNDSKAVIKYYINGNLHFSQTVDNNSTVTLNTAQSMNIAPEGYVFEGWATVPQGKVVYKDGAKIFVASASERVDLYAVLSPVSYNVYYYDNDGNLLQIHKNINYDTNITTPKYSSINTNFDERYICAGWARNANADDIEYNENAEYKNLGNKQDEIVKLYPVLKEAEKFEVKYQFTATQTAVDTGYYNNFTYTVKSPLDLGDFYSQDFIKKYFLGWSVDPEPDMVDLFAGEKIDSNEFLNENVTFYAVWSTKLVGINFDNSLAGQQSGIRYFPVGEKIGNIDGDNYYDENYTYKFVGWFTEIDGGIQITSDYIVEEISDGVTLYAHYEILPNVRPDAVSITVVKSDLGKTSLNGIDTTHGKSVSVDINSSITLKAVANAGAEFLGWKQGNKLVSIDEEYITTATDNMTFTPLFIKSEETKFTVVFVDLYGNVISSQTVSDGKDVVIPQAPIYPGYLFSEWSISENQISSLTDGKTIRANYTKDVSQTYTIKANGATISVGGKEYQDIATGVSYDAKVTVGKQGVTSWKIGDSTVAYGEKYTFYCAANIELTAVEDKNEEAKTQIAIISTNRPSSQAPDVLFIATRSIADGETVEKQGFIYGKNALASDLTLENVGKSASGANPGTIKVIYNNKSSNQIGLNYGLIAMSGNIGARAFVVTKDALGKEKVTYSNASIYTY